MLSIVVADGELYCADFLTYQIMTNVLQRMRGVSYFSLDWHKLKSG